MKINYILKIDELNTLIEDLKDSFKNGVVVLEGDLASGKTTFVKEFVKSLDIDECVTSPTFSLQQCYAEKIFHYDIYNHGLEHFISLGMLEELERDGIHFIEWGDERLIEILKHSGIDVMKIKIEKIAHNKREYKICMY